MEFLLRKTLSVKYSEPLQTNIKKMSREHRFNMIVRLNQKFRVLMKMKSTDRCGLQMLTNNFIRISHLKGAKQLADIFVKFLVEFPTRMRALYAMGICLLLEKWMISALLECILK